MRKPRVAQRPRKTEPDRLVASRRKRLARNIRSTFKSASLEKRTNAGSDLSLLLGPSEGLPKLDEIAPRIDPFLRACLLPPDVQEVWVAVVVKAKDRMDGVIAAVSRHRIVAAAIDPERARRRDVLDREQPLFLEVAARIREPGSADTGWPTCRGRSQPSGL
jgi:hypothetical protein